jgi:multidrug efflux pump subunit AcrB
MITEQNPDLIRKEIRIGIVGVLKLARQTPSLQSVRSNGLNDEPQLKIEIDREKANALSLTVSDVNATLAAAWGSEFIDQSGSGARFSLLPPENATTSKWSRPLCDCSG